VQACIKTALGKVEMLDVPIPDPGDGEILIKMTMATVRGSDMHFLDEYPNELLAGICADCLLPGTGLPWDDR
jgi:threonine dehydrogenase-like Zn-dependent dehydrogenase